MDHASIALAHEWLAERAGSEKTFEALAAVYPDADLYALTDALGDDLATQGRPVHTTVLDHAPVVRDRRALTLPLMPAVWRFAARRTYDVVITSSHACVKGFGPARDALHLCYCHTPMRYVWESDDRRGCVHALSRLGPGAAMRRWDRRSARWVDGFAANSTVVQQRIERCYGRPSRLIPPPVDTELYSPGPPADDAALTTGPYVMACSRFIGYKRLDLAIRAADRVGVPIVVAGSGPGEAALRDLAASVRVPVHFAGRPDDEHLRDLYRGAEAFIFPALEDFGIVAVEAQACGTPVVALAAGGALDTVVDGVTGALVERQQPDDFADGLRRVLDGEIERRKCVDHAADFSVDAFATRVRAWVDESVADRA